MKRLETILLLCLLSIKLSNANEFDDTIETIKEKLQRKSTLKDSGSFSNIPGPGCKSTSKIGIVGAGISGIHMAYELKRMGFKNVEILEKSGRTGGLLHEVMYEGFNYGVTASIFGTSSGRRLFDLFKKFGLVSKDQFFNIDLSSGMNFLNGREVDPIEIIKELDEYINIHQKLFGSYKSLIMPRPNPEVFEKVQGTFKEYLSSKGLKILQKQIEANLIYLGYRNPDDFGAMYGLAIFSPKFLLSIIMEKPFKVQNDGGFHELFRQMIKEQNITINFFYDVKSIVREDNGTITVEGMNIISKPKNFDFLIWTGPKYEFTRISNNFLNPKEVNLLTGVRGKSTSSALVVTENGHRNVPTKIEWDNCLAQNSKVCFSMDLYGDFLVEKNLTLKEYKKNNYTGIDGENPSKKRAFITFLYGTKDHFTSNLEIEENIQEYYRKIDNVSRAEVFELVLVEDYPKFWDADKFYESALWDLLDLQGKYNIWFLGAPAFFESTGDNVEHNSFLLDLMDKSNQEC